jgi:hypothetical protein
LQLLQSPPVEASAQAVSQQTPSVQKLEEHWSPPEHAAPFDFRPQDPLTQVFGGLQSPSLWQVLLHALFATLQM